MSFSPAELMGAPAKAGATAVERRTRGLLLS